MERYYIQPSSEDTSWELLENVGEQDREWQAVLVARFYDGDHVRGSPLAEIVRGLLNLVSANVPRAYEKYQKWENMELRREQDISYRVIAALCLREEGNKLSFSPFELAGVPRDITLIEDHEPTGVRAIRAVSPSSGVATLTQLEAAREKKG